MSPWASPPVDISSELLQRLDPASLRAMHMVSPFWRQQVEACTRQLSIHLQQVDCTTCGQIACALQRYTALSSAQLTVTLEQSCDECAHHRALLMFSEAPRLRSLDITFKEAPPHAVFEHTSVAEGDPQPEPEPLPFAAPGSALAALQSLKLENFKAVPPLPQMQRLTALDLTRSWIRDISLLKDLSNLQSLNLSCTQVSTVLPLRDMAVEQLTALNLSYTRVRDIYPLVLPSLLLPQLRDLDLSRTQIRDPEALSELRGLTRLSLSKTGVTHLRPLRKLKRLVVLDLSTTRVSAIDSLQRLTALRDLSLHGSEVDDLDVLRHLTSLERLDISGTPVEDLDVLEAAQHLTELKVADTYVQSVAPLTALTGLRSLEAAGNALWDLSPLTELPQLTRLDLARCFASNNVAVLTSLVTLEELCLMDSAAEQITVAMSYGGGPCMHATGPVPLASLREFKVRGVRNPAILEALRHAFPHATIAEGPF